MIQNETIAKALIAISDRMDDLINNRIGKPVQQTAQVQHTMGMPDIPGSRSAPRPMMPQFSAPLDVPPPPPSFGGDKKRGLFK